MEILKEFLCRLQTTKFSDREQRNLTESTIGVLQVVQLLSENAVEKRSEHVARLLSKSHDFAFSDTESQEDYGYTDDYESDMQRHRALALELE